MSSTYPTVAQFLLDSRATDGKAVRAHNHTDIRLALVERGRKLCGQATKPKVNTLAEAGNTAEVATLAKQSAKRDDSFCTIGEAFAGLEVLNA
jgi:hypothetical protein